MEFDFQFILTALFIYILLFYIFRYIHTRINKKKLLEVQNKLKNFKYTLSITRRINYKNEKVPVVYKTPQLFGIGFLDGKVNNIEMLVTWSPFSPKSLLFIVIHENFLDTHVILSSQKVKKKQFKRIQGKELVIDDAELKDKLTIKAKDTERIQTLLSIDELRSILKELIVDFSIIMDDRSIEIECPKTKIDKVHFLTQKMSELSNIINNHFNEKSK